MLGYRGGGRWDQTEQWGTWYQGIRFIGRGRGWVGARCKRAEQGSAGAPVWGERVQWCWLNWSCSMVQQSQQ